MDSQRGHLLHHEKFVQIPRERTSQENASVYTDSHNNITSYSPARFPGGRSKPGRDCSFYGGFHSNTAHTGYHKLQNIGHECKRVQRIDGSVHSVDTPVAEPETTSQLMNEKIEMSLARRMSCVYESLADSDNPTGEVLIRYPKTDTV